MQKYLPSEKFFLTLAVIIVGSVSVYFVLPNGSSKNEASLSAVINTENSGRGNATQLEVAKVTPSETTETKKLAQDIGILLLSSAEKGEKVSPETLGNALSSILKKAGEAQKILYTLSDIRVVRKTNETIALHDKYKENIQKLAPAHNIHPNDRKEIPLLEEILLEENWGRLSELEVIIAEYQSVEYFLLEAEVPESAHKSHLALLNGTRAIRESLQIIQHETPRDFLKTLLAYKNYQQGVKEATLSYKALKDTYK